MVANENYKMKKQNFEFDMNETRRSNKNLKGSKKSSYPAIAP